MTRNDELGFQHKQWSSEASVWDQGHTRSVYGNRGVGEGLTQGKEERSWDADSNCHAEGVRGSGSYWPLTCKSGRLRYPCVLQSSETENPAPGRHGLWSRFYRPVHT